MKRVEALRALEEVAAEQAGLITSAQATACGVDRMTQRRLAEAGMLENVGRGVYRLVGAPPPSHLELRVTWLRLDPATPAWQRNGLGPDDGVVSHRSACIVHDLGDIPAPRIELTVPRRRTTREPDVHLHTGTLYPHEVSYVDGLPVTSAEKTIVDLLRSRADGAHVGGVIAEAERRGLIDAASLADKVAGLGIHYGFPRAAGEDLLAHMAAQAGQRLSTTEIQQAMLAGVLAGSGMSDAIANMMMPSSQQALAAAQALGRRDELVRAAAIRALVPSSQQALAAITQGLGPSKTQVLTVLAQAMAPSSQQVLALAQSLAPPTQAATAQAVAAILSDPALTRQLQALRAPLAEIAAQAMHGSSKAAHRAITSATTAGRSADADAHDELDDDVGDKADDGNMEE